MNRLLDMLRRFRRHFQRKAARCTDCWADFTAAELLRHNARGCPACGSVSIPCDPAQDVSVRLNWHELRILTMWASNWAERECPDHTRKALHAIIKRLLRFRPKDVGALTLVQEVKELQQQFPGAGLYDGEGNPIVPPADGSER